MFAFYSNVLKTCLSRNLRIKPSSETCLNTIKVDVLLEFRRNAGHSKWKNIKAVKEVNDDKKKRYICALVRKIKTAVQEGGGSTNPKMNALLAKILDEGKANDVPGATMSRAIERIEKGRTNKGGPIFTEARSMSGGSFIIESFTDRQKHTRQMIQHVLKKYGGKIQELGTCSHMFHYKGVVYVPTISLLDQEKAVTPALDYDQAFELAIEAGAEEVVEDVDESSNKIFKFICDPKQLHTVRTFLTDQALKPYEARLEYVPHTFVTLDSDGLDQAAQIIEGLEAMEETEQVFHNIEPSSES